MHLISTACALSTLLAFLSTTQDGPVTAVDVYGLRTVRESEVRAAAEVEVGRPLAASVAEIEARVAALPGVAEAHVAPIVYPGNFVVFVGIREEGTPAQSFRPAPRGEVRLEPVILDAYDAAMAQLVPAIRAGQAGEDRSAGHSLSQYEPMRAIELEFVAFANESFEHLTDVLRNSRDAAGRAAAAAVIAYADDKPRVAVELSLAAADPDSGVRNNAVRALSIVASYGFEHPELGLTVDPEPFLALLESLVWTDRNKGAAALDSLTQARDPKLLEFLAARSLDELAEMARWKSGGHATFSLRILARVAGLEEADLAAKIQSLYGNAEGRAAWVDELVGKVTARESAPPSGPERVSEPGRVPAER